MADKSIVSNSKLTAIANAIRSKTGTTDSLTLDNMVTKIQSMGGASSGSGKNIMKTYLDWKQSCASMFSKYTGTNVDGFQYSDTENVTNMKYMFYNCKALTEIPLLNTGKVTDMESMFNSCKALNTIPQLDTSNVTTMEDMFYGCNNLQTIPLLNTSNVTNMFQMFYGCNNLQTIPQLDTSNVTNMNSMFAYCELLQTIPLLNTSNVTYMSSMFNNCISLTTIPQLDTSNVTTMNNMFNSCTNLQTIPQLDTSNVTNMGSMFGDCTSLTTIPLLNLIKVGGASSMFWYCSSLTNLTLKNIKVTLQIGNGTSWGHLLTLDSLVNTIKELVDTGSSKTLTMGSANLKKIANVYVRLTGEAEEVEGLTKLPCEVCNETDEGAMLITAYANLKNWSLA